MPGASVQKSASLSVETLTGDFSRVRNASREITAPFSPEDQMLQSMPDASPAKWHLAHTTWFFETFILLPNVAGYKPFDERYQFLFNSYYKQYKEPCIVVASKTLVESWIFEIFT